MRLCYKRQYFLLCNLFLLLSVLSLSSKIAPEISVSAVSATAAISAISILFLNLVSCLVRTNSSLWNNRSRAGPSKLFNDLTATSGESPLYSNYIHATRCHQRCSPDRNKMHVTYFFFYDHDATQSECAHRLVKLYTKISLVKTNSRFPRYS